LKIVDYVLLLPIHPASARQQCQFDDLKSAFIQVAAGYTGATGPTTLNAAGDRAGGAFDFWSLKPSTNTFIWFRSASYEPGVAGGGTLIRYP
jgi:hypothetical protein